MGFGLQKDMKYTGTIKYLHDSVFWVNFLQGYAIFSKTIWNYEMLYVSYESTYSAFQLEPTFWPFMIWFRGILS